MKYTCNNAALYFSHTEPNYNGHVLSLQATTCSIYFYWEIVTKY